VDPVLVNPAEGSKKVALAFYWEEFDQSNPDL